MPGTQIDHKSIKGRKDAILEYDRCIEKRLGQGRRATKQSSGNHSESTYSTYVLHNATIYVQRSLSNPVSFRVAQNFLER